MHRLAGLIAMLAAGTALANDAPIQPNRSASRTRYIEHCGGCHGVDGKTQTQQVPLLRDRVGVFLCSAQGRSYVGRLPNIALSGIPDNAVLANLVNFVIFELGGASAPSNATPYTADEIGRLRQHPLTISTLGAERSRILATLRTACGKTAVISTRHEVVVPHAFPERR